MKGLYRLFFLIIYMITKRVIGHSYNSFEGFFFSFIKYYFHSFINKKIVTDEVA